MQNIKLTLGYDGTAYHGFQVQENALAVQEMLERAIAVVFGSSIRVAAAGRTDAGVHATGQVVNFYADTTIPAERIPHALNAVLPKDIVVYHAENVIDSFNARFNAVSKVYTYTIDNAEYPRVLALRYAYHVKHNLNVRVMKSSAIHLEGNHDFTSFCATGSSTQRMVRNMMRLEVEEKDSFITITAEAGGFLYNMMRIIAGTLIEIGRSKRSPDLARVLVARDRAAAGWTAPAHGLVLREVKYDDILKDDRKCL